MDELDALIDTLKQQMQLEYKPDTFAYEVIGHVVKEIGESRFVITPINGIEWPRFGISEEES